MGERCRVIAISDAWRLWPKAEVLYSCDAKWWDHYGGVPEFKGLKVGLHNGIRQPGVNVMCYDDTEGFSPDPGFLRTGLNSGYQAVHLAAHFGVKRIILLGFDMRVTGSKTHYFGSHPRGLEMPSPFDTFIKHFKTLVEPLKERGVEVINCTPNSALPWFGMKPLRETL